jgi:hypothetical protein
MLPVDLETSWKHALVSRQFHERYSRHANIESEGFRIEAI